MRFQSVLRWQGDEPKFQTHRFPPHIRSTYISPPSSAVPTTVPHQTRASAKPTRRRVFKAGIPEPVFRGQTASHSGSFYSNPFVVWRVNSKPQTPYL